MTLPISSTVEIDGQTYTLHFDLDTVARVERQTGRPIDEVIAMASRGFVSCYLPLVHGLLQKHHGHLTTDDALALMARAQETGASLAPFAAQPHDARRHH